MLPDDVIKETHKQTMDALIKRERAIEQLAEVADGIKLALKTKARAKNVR
jgi:hypothetical protein